MEFVVIFAVLACIVWLFWKVRADVRESRRATELNLEKAWQLVLNDPNYARRRPHEERKHEFEERARKESEALQ